MKRGITDEFLQECEDNFSSDPANIIARNSIVSVGSIYATTDSNRLNELSHIFLNTVKHKNLKATDQGSSGRCWMFAALNTFRHMLIKALGLENFEFSEVYLFFWDKLERSNTYINWFINHPQYKPGSRAFDYVLTDFLTDGGWWNTFANLVNKYGLVPGGAMKETFQSSDSEIMNATIKERLDSCVNHIIHQRNRGVDDEGLHAIRKKTMKQVYSILVKFLGEPPKKFDWSFHNEDSDPMSIIGLTPQKFKSMIIPDIDMHEFVAISHVPTEDLEFGKMYRIRWTNNVEEGKECTLLNVDCDDLARYAKESILAGMAVWFVGDVRKHFNFMHSTLDDKLDASELVFGRPYDFEKGERITFRNVEGNHAMALTGVNVDDYGRPVSWQVENSWGFYDNEEPGMDGFLTMSHSWFKKYVIEIVVHNRFLSRSLKKMLKQEPIVLNPWDCMAPATKAGVIDAPKNYIEIMSKRRRTK